jgi:Xaa-Pro aminopeptidase
MLTRQDRLIRWCREKYPLHQYERAAKLTRELRMIKSDAEIDLLKEAISISKKCFDNVFKAFTPTAYEYEIEAQLTHELIRNGATRHAFKPIIASGKNACIMHYNSNDSICREGSMVLIDFGVCYANYNSDITRCIPVNGIFSTRQRAVYESVLQCLKNGATLLKPGKSFREYEKQMAALIEEELIKLNLITPKEIETQLPDQPAYKKYFMHGTAHHLGLDVHDVGHYSGFIEKGMVLTCEPGIYIPEENLGCRLENNYLITENGNINLTAAIPIEVDDIETLCKRSKNKMHSA